MADPFFRLVVTKTATKKIIDDAYRSKGVVVRDYRPIYGGMVWIDIFIESCCEDSVTFKTKWRMILGKNFKTLN